MTRRDVIKSGAGIAAILAAGRAPAALVKSMLGARMTIASVAKRLPYDAEVEYLEATGEQYIDTGVIGVTPCHIRLDATFTSSQDNAVLLGATNTSDLANKAIYLVAQYPAGACFIRIGNSYQSYGSIPINNMSDIDVEVSASTAVVKIGNTQVLQFSVSANQNVGANLYLFATNRNGMSSFFCKAKVSYLQIIIGGSLVRDFIPVRVGTVGYMYDRVSGQFFGNQGTGAFVIGPDK